MDVFQSLNIKASVLYRSIIIENKRQCGVTLRKLHRNQIKSFIINTGCIPPERVTSLRGPSTRHFVCATAQLVSKKCRSGGEPLATLCPVWQTRGVNLRPPAPVTNAVTLDQMAGCKAIKTH